MSYTDQDVREGRSLMNKGRGNRLAIGEKLLAITASGDEAAFDQYCDEISIGPRLAREYRQTARMCTPPVRQLVDDGGVHVAYSVLREGAATGPGGLPHDEGYRTLKSLLEEARTAGTCRVTLPQYKRALGTGPAFRDLLEGQGGDATVDEYRNALLHDPAERDKIINALLEEEGKLRDSVTKSLEDTRRRDREQPGGCTDIPKPDKGGALLRDLIRLRDQAVAMQHRYPRQVSLSAEQHDACMQLIGSFGILHSWVKSMLGVPESGTCDHQAASPYLVSV